MQSSEIPNVAQLVPRAQRVADTEHAAPKAGLMLGVVGLLADVTSVLL